MTFGEWVAAVSRIIVSSQVKHRLPLGASDDDSVETLPAALARLVLLVFRTSATHTLWIDELPSCR